MASTLNERLGLIAIELGCVKRQGGDWVPSMRALSDAAGLSHGTFSAANERERASGVASLDMSTLRALSRLVAYDKEWLLEGSGEPRLRLTKRGHALRADNEAKHQKLARLPMQRTFRGLGPDPSPRAGHSLFPPADGPLSIRDTPAGSRERSVDRTQLNMLMDAADELLERYGITPMEAARLLGGLPEMSSTLEYCMAALERHRAEQQQRQQEPDDKPGKKPSR